MQMELGIVVLRVENWYRAVDWYRDVLGLTELYRDEAAQEAQFQAGPVHLAVEPASAQGATEKDGSTGFVLQFRVDNLDDTVSELAARGVQFTTDISEQEWGRVVTCVDLEGNEIQIYEQG
jgi:predicted enzyme related to lactoylglutathione lyase